MSVSSQASVAAAIRTQPQPWSNHDSEEQWTTEAGQHIKENMREAQKARDTAMGDAADDATKEDFETSMRTIRGQPFGKVSQRRRALCPIADANSSEAKQGQQRISEQTKESKKSPQAPITAGNKNKSHENAVNNRGYPLSSELPLPPTRQFSTASDAVVSCRPFPLSRRTDDLDRRGPPGPPLALLREIRCHGNDESDQYRETGDEEETEEAEVEEELHSSLQRTNGSCVHHHLSPSPLTCGMTAQDAWRPSPPAGQPSNLSYISQLVKNNSSIGTTRSCTSSVNSERPRYAESPSEYYGSTGSSIDRERMYGPASEPSWSGFARVRGEESDSQALATERQPSSNRRSISRVDKRYPTASPAFGQGKSPRREDIILYPSSPASAGTVLERRHYAVGKPRVCIPISASPGMRGTSGGVPMRKAFTTGDTSLRQSYPNRLRSISNESFASENDNFFEDLGFDERNVESPHSVRTPGLWNSDRECEVGRRQKAVRKMEESKQKAAEAKRLEAEARRLEEEARWEQGELQMEGKWRLQGIEADHHRFPGQRQYEDGWRQLDQEQQLSRMFQHATNQSLIGATRSRPGFVDLEDPAYAEVPFGGCSDSSVNCDCVHGSRSPKLDFWANGRDHNIAGPTLAKSLQRAEAILFPSSPASADVILERRPYAASKSRMHPSISASPSATLHSSKGNSTRRSLTIEEPSLRLPFSSSPSLRHQHSAFMRHSPGHARGVDICPPRAQRNDNSVSQTGSLHSHFSYREFCNNEEDPYDNEQEPCSADSFSKRVPISTNFIMRPRSRGSPVGRSLTMEDTSLGLPFWDGTRSVSTSPARHLSEIDSCDPQVRPGNPFLRSLQEDFNVRDVQSLRGTQVQHLGNTEMACKVVRRQEEVRKMTEDAEAADAERLDTGMQQCGEEAKWREDIVSSSVATAANPTARHNDLGTATSDSRTNLQLPRSMSDARIANMEEQTSRRRSGNVIGTDQTSTPSGMDWWRLFNKQRLSPRHRSSRGLLSDEQTAKFNDARGRVIRAAKSVLGNSADITHEVLTAGADLLNYAPIPGLAAAACILLDIWGAFEQVQSNRFSCMRLVERCASVLQSVRDEIASSGNAVSEELKHPIQKLEDSFTKVLEVIKNHLDMPFLKRFLGRDKILHYLEHCDTLLTDALWKFGLSIQTRTLKLLQISHVNGTNMLGSLIHRFASRNKTRDSIENLCKQQNIEDRKQDIAELRRLLHAAVETSDDFAMVEILQIGPGEMHEAMEALVHTLNHYNPHGTIEQGDDDLDRKFMRNGVEALRRLTGRQGTPVRLPSWTVSRFEINLDRQISYGPFSAVYKGTWRNNVVAIKLLAEVTLQKLFVREANIWQSLSHPNIVKLLGASSTSSDPPWFFVSPYYENGNLVKYLKDLSTLVDAVALRMMYEISSGMAYLHHRGVLHGDLKAVNVLVDDRDRCVITDFGQSELKSEVYRVTQQPIIRGTLRWRAPELLGGATTALTQEIDVYAFAITCVEIITKGSLPWDMQDDDDVRHAVLEWHERPPLSPSSFRVDKGLKAILRACWHQDPSSRPPFSQISSRLDGLRHFP